MISAAGTVAGAAHGQARTSTGRATPAVTTPVTAMSLQQCSLAAEVTPNVPHSDYEFNQLPAACGNVLGQHLTSTAAAQPHKVRRMFRPDPATWPENLASTTPNNLRNGLLEGFVEADTRLKSNTEVSYGGTMLAFASPVGSSLIHTHTIQEAIAHRAHQDWDDRGYALGDASNPCGEWVWKGFYDYSRFEDAAEACGTNDECVYRVAYSSTSHPPAVAFRSLRSMDSSGEYFDATYNIPLVNGFLSKNPFFGISSAILLDQQKGLLEDLEKFEMQRNAVVGGKVELQAGPKNYACAGNFKFRNPQSKYYVDPTSATASADLAAVNQNINNLRVLLQKKAGYLLGNYPFFNLFPNAERFSSEWSYHQAMHQRQKPLAGQPGDPLPDAERRAIDERTKTMLDLMEKYAIITSLVAHKKMDITGVVRPGNPIDEALDRIVIPGIDDLGPGFDDLGGGVPDPFLRRMALSSMRGDLVAPTQALSFERAGSVVTNQMIVPFSLVRGPSASTPMSTTTTMSFNPKDSSALQPTVLMGAERDYGKATEVARASVSGSTTTCPSPDPETENTTNMYDLARAAQEVQEQIVALLIDELGRGADGCLSENGYNCDWSPTLFAQRFKGQFSEARENAFQYCVLMTGGNTLDNPDPLFKVEAPERKMSTFPGQLESVKGELKAMLDGLPYVQMGVNDDRVGEVVSGGKEIGNASWFGASYNYNAGWSVTPKFAPTATEYTTACGFQGTASAEFNAGVSILGNSVPLVHAEGSGIAANGTGSHDMSVEFGGQSFLRSADSEVFHVVESGSNRLGGASATVVVVVVPVTFQAYGELEYGYDVEAKTTSSDACGGSGSPRLGLQFRLQPFAKVNAVASAGVGVSGAQAGVRGRIALLDAKLPIEASLELKPDPNAGSSVKLFPTASANFNVATLSGRMSVFAEVGVSPFDYEAEKTIYSWGGLKDSIPLWQLDSDPVQLAAFYKSGWDQWKDANK